MLKVINGITLLSGKYSWALIVFVCTVQREESLSIRGLEELSTMNVGLLLAMGAFQWRGINSYFEHAILQQSQRHQ